MLQCLGLLFVVLLAMQDASVVDSEEADEPGSEEEEESEGMTWEELEEEAKRCAVKHDALRVLLNAMVRRMQTMRRVICSLLGCDSN